MDSESFIAALRYAVDWNELKAVALTCERCSLREGCKQVVFGCGNVQARLMVIGEGPGADEDRVGDPFVGAAGQLLDRILESGGFSRRHNAYIANIVKCRPPGNRAPAPEEREACLPILREQFRRLRPQIVILLGATAAQAILDPQIAISRERGKWHKKGDTLFMPTYHPAALLRNEHWKKDVWEDIKEVVRLYRDLVDENHMPGLRV